MKTKPLAVVVLDDAGDVRPAARGRRQQIAQRHRRRQGLGLGRHGRSSRTLLQRAKDNPQFFGALSVTGQGRFVPQTGAVLIKDKDGTVIGAAGARAAPATRTRRFA